MKKALAIVITCMLCGCSSPQEILETIKHVLSHSPNQEMTIRQLTLSIRQSAESVSNDPALFDLVDLESFQKGGLVYVNQPFNFTYRQEGLTFNIPRTHTLQLIAENGRLNGITAEIFPIIEDDFEGALRILSK